MLALLVVLVAVVRPGSAEPRDECTAEPLAACDVWESLTRLDRVSVSERLVDKIVFHAHKTSGLRPCVVTRVSREGEPPMEGYGVFQLLDRLACTGGSKETRDVCRMNCSDLLDDDITDDIRCLFKLIEFAKRHAHTQDKELQRLLNRGLFFNTALVPERHFDLCKTRGSAAATLH